MRLFRIDLFFNGILEGEFSLRCEDMIRVSARQTCSCGYKLEGMAIDQSQRPCDERTIGIYDGRFFPYLLLS
jgi:hypothetical protein